MVDSVPSSLNDLSEDGANLRSCKYSKVGVNYKKGMRSHPQILVWVLTLLNLIPISLQAEETIPPDSPLIRYSGRVIVNKTRGAIFDWPGVSIHAGFKGTEAGFLIDGAKNNLEVKVDGEAVTTWTCDPSPQTYWIKGLSEGNHQVEIVKRTEGLFGPVIFQGMVLDSKSEAQKPFPPPEHRIEFIGDSWICGYGDEATTLHCKDLRPYENADRAFGALTARALGAEYHLTAFSGRGVVRNYAEKGTSSQEPFGVLFNRTLVEARDCPWDFSQWVPDAVVIHLGLNDFSSTPHPAPQDFIEGYRKLLQQVRAAYPQAWIICFATTGWPFFSPLVKEASDSFNRGGDPKVMFAGYPSVPLSELGCDYHPQVVAHQRLADILAPVIRKTLGWGPLQ